MGGIGYEKIVCSDCGKEYDAMVLDGHISQPILCDRCMRNILNEYFTNNFERKMECILKEFMESAPDRLIAGEGRREK